MTRLLSVLFTLALVACALAMAGCRSRGRVYEEIRHRDELFAREDRNFELLDQVESLQQQRIDAGVLLSACR